MSTEKEEIAFNYRQLLTLISHSPKSEEDVKTLQKIKLKWLKFTGLVVLSIGFLALIVFAVSKRIENSKMQISGFPWATIGCIAFILNLLSVIDAVMTAIDIFDIYNEASNLVNAIHYRNLYCLWHPMKITNYVICVVTFFGIFACIDLHRSVLGFISFLISAVCFFAGIGLYFADDNAEYYLQEYTGAIMCDHCPRNEDLTKNTRDCSWHDWEHCKTGKIKDWLQGKIRFADYRETNAMDA